MTLYDLINEVDEAFTPTTHTLKDFIIHTSDNNGGFLRTCYRRKKEPLANIEIGDPDYILIAFQEEYTEDSITLNHNPNGELTKAKLQLCYWTNENIADEVSLYMSLGYIYCYIISSHGEIFKISATKENQIIF